MIIATLGTGVYIILGIIDKSPTTIYPQFLANLVIDDSKESAGKLESERKSLTLLNPDSNNTK